VVQGELDMSKDKDTSRGIATNSSVISLFPTNIMKFKLWGEYPHWEDLLNDLVVTEETEPTILEGPGRTSFIEDWHQRSFLLERYPELESIVNACCSNYCYTHSLEHIELDDSWYTIMNKGSKIQRHRHEGSVLSGTIFVNVPEDTYGLAFANPTIPHRMMERQNATHESTTYAHLEQVETGDVLIYPSWMEHFVPKIECDYRATISFNTAYPAWRKL
jgi:uncharacterized protein (TIGR02466 family)